MSQPKTTFRDGACPVSDAASRVSTQDLFCLRQLDETT
jgi:hypothetical protein